MYRALLDTYLYVWWSTMYMYMQVGSLYVVHAIIELGADVKAVDNLGRNAMHTAANMGAPYVSNFLSLSLSLHVSNCLTCSLSILSPGISCTTSLQLKVWTSGAGIMSKSANAIATFSILSYTMSLS